MDISMDMPGSDSGTEVLEYAVALTGTAHLMTDYLLSSDTALQDFCQFYAGGEAMPLPTDEKIQEMSEVLAAAHDTFAAMTARAQGELLLARLAGGLNIDASPDIAS